MNALCDYFNSSIGKKQIVALTGLLLIFFVIGHLAGNLIIYLGPDAFNAYAKKLASLRPGLYLIEGGLLFIFCVHMYVTALLVWQNFTARKTRYAVTHSTEQRSWAARTMSLTGPIVLAFVIWHLLDFTFIDKHGPESYLSDGKSYGLYGIVFNAFTDPIHSTLYIIAMIAVGLHVSHGVKSFIQTFGFNTHKLADYINTISVWFAIFVTFAYSSIPLYIMYLNG